MKQLLSRVAGALFGRTLSNSNVRRTVVDEPFDWGPAADRGASPTRQSWSKKPRAERRAIRKRARLARRRNRV